MTHIISGDQSILWDAPLKLAILARKLPRNVRHYIHSGDYFSKGGEERRMPIHAVKFGDAVVSPEYALPDGNINRWSASLESARFLGKMPLSPRELSTYGVDWSSLCAHTGRPLDHVVATATESDWIGVSLPERPEEIAHEISFEKIRLALKHVRKLMRTDLVNALRLVPGSKIGELDVIFGETDQSFDTWGEYATYSMERTLRHLGVGDRVTVKTTYARQGRKIPNIFKLFVEHYDVCAQAYNDALAMTGEEILPINRADRELPFSVILNKGGRILRVDAYTCVGDSVEKLIRRYDAQCEVRGIIGKAIVNLLEILTHCDIVLPEKGSQYASTTLVLARLLRERLPVFSEFHLHRILRLQVNALDALRDIKGSVLLPKYLAEELGVETIQLSTLGEQWRSIANRAKNDAHQLRRYNHNDVVTKLLESGKTKKDAERESAKYLANHRRELWQAVRAQGGIGGLILDRHTQMVGWLREYEKEKLDYIERLKGSGEKPDPREFDRITRRHDPSALYAGVRAIEDAIEFNRCSLLTRKLQVAKALPYWNARPFSSWIFAVPGWFEAILGNASIKEEGEPEQSVMAA